MKTTPPNVFFVFSFPDGFPTCSKAKLFRLAPQHSQWLPSLKSMPKLDCLGLSRQQQRPFQILHGPVQCVRHLCLRSCSQTPPWSAL